MKYKLKQGKSEKSVSVFQHEYLEFKFEYGDFQEKIRLKTT